MSRLAAAMHSRRLTSGATITLIAAVEIGIVGSDGNLLLDTKLQPVRIASWPTAEAVHGISPADVREAPTLLELAASVRESVRNRVVVVYNAGFDTQFLTGLLWPAASIRCCMLAYASHIGNGRSSGTAATAGSSWRRRPRRSGTNGRRGLTAPPSTPSRPARSGATCTTIRGIFGSREQKHERGEVRARVCGDSRSGS